MGGIVVIAHEDLPDELIRAAEYILDRSEPRLLAVGVCSERNYEKIHDQVGQALDRVRDEDGAILLADMYGGTPANLAVEFLDPGKVEVITGVNLPMLVRLLTYRDQPLQEQVDKGVEGGHRGIVLGRDLWSRNSHGGEHP